MALPAQLHRHLEVRPSRISKSFVKLRVAHDKEMVVTLRILGASSGPYKPFFYTGIVSVQSFTACRLPHSACACSPTFRSERPEEPRYQPSLQWTRNWKTSLLPDQAVSPQLPSKPASTASSSRVSSYRMIQRTLIAVF
jgi:hypothetical protein